MFCSSSYSTRLLSVFPLDDWKLSVFYFGSESLLEDWPALPLIWSTLQASADGPPSPPVTMPISAVSPQIQLHDSAWPNTADFPVGSISFLLSVHTSFCLLELEVASQLICYSGKITDPHKYYYLLGIPIRMFASWINLPMNLNT